MVKILIAAILFILVIPAAYADTQKMFFCEYRVIHPSIQEGTFAAQPLKVWRVGFRYLRVEEAADPAEHLHILTISKAPDTYMINKYTKSGKHLIDRAENIDVHVPIFTIADVSKEIWKLEMGHENAFFDEHNATSSGTTTIEGIKCNVYSTEIDNIKLTLYKRQDNGNPLQVGIDTGKIAYDIRYIQYKPDLTPDYKLFEVPAGITLVDAN